jgi:FtsX-like permease family protein/MacB-like protein
VLAHGFWQSRYGGHPGVIGQPIMLDRHPFEIIGVAPPQFFGAEIGRTFDVAIPRCAEPLIRGAQSGVGVPNVWWLDIMGRLKPDWTVQRAEAHLATISSGIFQATVSPRYNAETAKAYTAFKITAKPAGTGVSNLRTEYAAQLWVLLGATGLVLLITCANLANLMLARATARDREIAVRLAIGASRGRIVRQMLSESLLIAGLGAAPVVRRRGGRPRAGWSGGRMDPCSEGVTACADDCSARLGEPTSSVEIGRNRICFSDRAGRGADPFSQRGEPAARRPVHRPRPAAAAQLQTSRCREW